MAELQTIRRITVYAAEGLEKSLIAHFLALGARGYTIVECRGVGEHATLDDPFARSSHVRIELLVHPAVADKIVDYVSEQEQKHLAVVACVESVQVGNPKHF